MKNRWRNIFIYITATLCIALFIPGNVHATLELTPVTVLSDNFTTMSSSNWYIPTWKSSDDGTYVGRTQFRCTQHSTLPQVNNGNAIITVQSYNPTGYSFYGYDLISKKSFTLGQGVIVTVRAKLDAPAQAGVVGGIFLYALKSGSSTLHDEIDFELLGNHPGRIWTNIYGNEALGAGHAESYSYASGSNTDYHIYEIKWLPDRVTWSIDGTIIRTDTNQSPIPAGPMNLHLNMWVPDTAWADAYSGSIQPVKSAGSNQVFSMSVDYVLVQSLKLPDPPSAPTLVSPSAGFVSNTLMPTLDWNDSAGATSYGVQVSTSSSFATLLVNQTGLIDSTYILPDSMLSWNTKYYWRANAASEAGSSAWSSIRNFKTAVGPPPAAPTGLTARAISSTQINLAWQDNSSDEDGFKIERQKGSGAFTQIAKIASNVTSYSNASGLSADTDYTYRVRAYRLTLNSDYSNNAAATTWPKPPRAPALLSPANGATIVTLTPTLDWNEPTGAASYDIQISTMSNLTAPVINESGLADSNYTIVGGLDWNTLYYWRVKAVDSYGGASAWSGARRFRTATGPPPEAPSNLTSVAISSTQVNLNWQDNSTGETGFKIERKKGSGAFAQVAQVGPDVTGYRNTSGLAANTTYTYRVRAYLGTLNSGYSNNVSVMTLPSPPAVPVLLSPASGAKVATLTPTLDWNEPSGAVRYAVQVSSTSGFSSRVIDESEVNASTYNITENLSWNMTYYWRVKAIDAYGGASRWSSARNFRTVP